MLEQGSEEYLHSDLTRRIIGAAYEVHKHLGHGFLEKVYVNALVLELASLGLAASTEMPLDVVYKGQVVGIFFADVVVDRVVICEIKAVNNLAPEHEAQLLNYLKATGVKVDLLINFGSRSVQIKRLVF